MNRNAGSFTKFYSFTYSLFVQNVNEKSADFLIDESEKEEFFMASLRVPALKTKMF